MKKINFVYKTFFALLLSVFTLINLLASSVQAVPDISDTPVLAWQQSTLYSQYNAPLLVGAVGYYPTADTSQGYPNYQWRIEKRDLITGALIPGFGVSGVLTVNPSVGYDVLASITTDGDNLYLFGTDSIPGNDQWRIEKRDLITGALIPGFGTGGVVTNNPSVANDQALAVSIDDTGLYLAGNDRSPGNDQWRIEKRDLTTGALVAEFGNNGVVNVNPSAANYENARGIKIINSNLYIIGADRATSGSNYQWRIEKRDLITGALIPEFGTGGVVTNNPSVLDDTPNAIANDINGLYIVGDDGTTGNYQWRIEKRDLITGALIPEFGTGGVVTHNPSSSNWDSIYDIILDSTGFYINARDCSLGDDKIREYIQKRDLTTGALLQNFGLNGVLELEYGNSYNFISDLALDSTGLYFSRSVYGDGLYKYAFPEDSTPPALGNLPGLTTPINLEAGQVVTTNPYVINVKPDDNIDVAYVEFYVDGVLICTDNTADINGVYSCDWDTSKYHSDIRVIAYDTTGNQSVALERSVTVNLGDTLPDTGTSAWIYLLGLLPVVGILVVRRD